MKHKYSFVEIGPGGWTLYQRTIGSSKSRLQGYHQGYHGHMHEVEEGSLVLDKRPCEGRDDWVKSVLSSPLVDVDLSGDSVDRLATKNSIMHSVDAFAGMLAVHEQQQAKGKIGSLDSVSPEFYCAWWQERGARVGYVQDDEIVWQKD